MRHGGWTTFCTEKALPDQRAFGDANLLILHRRPLAARSLSKTGVRQIAMDARDRPCANFWLRLNDLTRIFTLPWKDEVTGKGHQLCCALSCLQFSLWRSARRQAQTWNSPVITEGYARLVDFAFPIARYRRLPKFVKIAVAVERRFQA
jgi:hypothetical protein